MFFFIVKTLSQPSMGQWNASPRDDNFLGCFGGLEGIRCAAARREGHSGEGMMTDSEIGGVEDWMVGLAAEGGRSGT